MHLQPFKFKLLFLQNNELKFPAIKLLKDLNKKSKIRAIGKIF